MTKERSSTVTSPSRASKTPVSHGVGRRKSAVARVWLTRGSGEIIVNGRSVTRYFDTDNDRKNVELPLSLLTSKDVNVRANVTGGGKRGQSDAVRLGIVRALVANDDSLRPLFRQNDLITTDSRVKERKKYGQRGARRKFQFVKR